MGCKGCLPPQAWEEQIDMLKPEWRQRKPSEWSHQDCRDWQYEEGDESEDGVLVPMESSPPEAVLLDHKKPGEGSRLQADLPHLVTPFN